MSAALVPSQRAAAVSIAGPRTGGIVPLTVCPACPGRRGSAGPGPGLLTVRTAFWRPDGPGGPGAVSVDKRAAQEGQNI